MWLDMTCLLPMLRVPLKYGSTIPMPATVAISPDSSLLDKFVDSS